MTHGTAGYDARCARQWRPQIQTPTEETWRNNCKQNALYRRVASQSLLTTAGAENLSTSQGTTNSRQWARLFFYSSQVPVLVCSHYSCLSSLKFLVQRIFRTRVQLRIRKRTYPITRKLSQYQQRLGLLSSNISCSELYLAMRMKSCNICGEKPSTLGIMTTRTDSLSTCKSGLILNFFLGDILSLLDVICSLYQADKVRKLHWFFFKRSFTTSSKSSSYQQSKGRTSSEHSHKNWEHPEKRWRSWRTCEYMRFGVFKIVKMLAVLFWVIMQHVGGYSFYPEYGSHLFPQDVYNSVTMY